MAYTPYSVDPNQAEQAILAYLNRCKADTQKTVTAAQAKLNGVEETVNAIVDMLHCSNYESRVTETAAYRKGWVDAMRAIGRVFVPGVVLDDITAGIDPPQYDANTSEGSPPYSAELLQKSAEQFAARIKSAMEEANQN